MSNKKDKELDKSIKGMNTKDLAEAILNTPSLHWLDLGDDMIGDEVDDLYGPNDLDENNKIDLEGAKALAKALQGTNITSLRLAPISSEGTHFIAKALADPKYRLTSLDLSPNKISDEDGDDLYGPNDYENIKISSEDAKALAKALPHNLTSLRFTPNRIGSEATKLIAEALPNPRVTGYKDNYLDPESAKNISKDMKALIEAELLDLEAEGHNSSMSNN